MNERLNLLKIYLDAAYILSSFIFLIAHLSLLRITDDSTSRSTYKN
jgi:hypothetical protein